MMASLGCADGFCTRRLTKRTRVESQLVKKIVEFEVMTKRAWFTMINAHQQAETLKIFMVSATQRGQISYQNFADTDSAVSDSD